MPRIAFINARAMSNDQGPAAEGVAHKISFLENLKISEIEVFGTGAFHVAGEFEILKIPS